MMNHILNQLIWIDSLFFSTSSTCYFSFSFSPRHSLTRDFLFSVDLLLNLFLFLLSFPSYLLPSLLPYRLVFSPLLVFSSQLFFSSSSFSFSSTYFILHSSLIPTPRRHTNHSLPFPFIPLLFPLLFSFFHCSLSLRVSKKQREELVYATSSSSESNTHCRHHLNNIRQLLIINSILSS